jgi:HK97 family phage portal protein
MRFSEWIKSLVKNSTINPSRAQDILGNQRPILEGVGGNIYASDFVNNCIDRCATEISKIKIKSVVEQQGIAIANDDITRLFRFKPNPSQTTSDFLSCIEWQRRKNMNCWIYPQYEWAYTPTGNAIKQFKAFYVLNPRDVSIGIGDSYNEIKMTFTDGSVFTFPESELINIKWRRGVNPVLGGDDYGRPDDQNLTNVVDALHKTIDGLPKSIEASLQIKGVYAVKSAAESSKLDKIRDDFESHILKSKTGIIATDLVGDFSPTKIDYADIDSETLKFLKSNICERYGVSLEILSGKYTAEDYSSFYQSCIEDFIVQFEQAFTEYCFTPREKDVGHEVKCYFSLLQRLSPQDNINLTIQATNAGLMYVDEIRTKLFGMEPLPNGEGQVRLQSLNYVDANHANEYQLSGKSGSTGGGNQNE